MDTGATLCLALRIGVVAVLITVGAEAASASDASCNRAAPAIRVLPSTNTQGGPFADIRPGATALAVNQRLGPPSWAPKKDTTRYYIYSYAREVRLVVAVDDHADVRTVAFGLPHSDDVFDIGDPHGVYLNEERSCVLKQLGPQVRMSLDVLQYGNGDVAWYYKFDRANRVQWIAHSRGYPALLEMDYIVASERIWPWFALLLFLIAAVVVPRTGMLLLALASRFEIRFASNQLLVSQRLADIITIRRIRIPLDAVEEVTYQDLGFLRIRLTGPRMPLFYRVLGNPVTRRMGICVRYRMGWWVRRALLFPARPGDVFTRIRDAVSQNRNCR
jgi:hypothetical protein